jgi:hypothetical protein
MLIKFVAQSYTHPWKDFANNVHLVLHASKIPLKNYAYAVQPNMGALDL